MALKPIKQSAEKQLLDSYEAGVITKEEYEEKKEALSKEAEQAQVQEEQKPVEEEKGADVKSDKSLLILLSVLGVVVAIFVVIFIFTPEEAEFRELTLEELLELNARGELPADEEGVVYRGQSFVQFQGEWYTQLVSPGGSRLYNIQFRFTPPEVEDLAIEGDLDVDLFDSSSEYYATFDPTAGDFSWVATAIADYNTHMTNIFFKNPIGACDRNETSACVGRPIITCNNTDELVLYVKSVNDSTSVTYDGNCILVEGNGEDLVRGVDRVLYNLYGLMTKESTV